MASHQNRTIVFITPGQPTTNPRLVKEATTLAEMGYSVTVLYNFWAEWTGEYDEAIKASSSRVQWIETGGNPDTTPFSYNLARLRHKCFRLLHRLFPGNISYAARAEIRGFKALSIAAKKYKADLYVAHNLGALPVAANAATIHKTKYAFDAEDFHFGQRTIASRESRRVTMLEAAFLPGAAYVTAASPMIAEQYEKRYDFKPVVINNVFPKRADHVNKQKKQERLKLFWFSQTIGTGRGLEDVFKALSFLPVEKFSLYLLGYINNEMRCYFEQLASVSHSKKIDVSFLDPVHPDQIVTIAEDCDIGLALEPGRDLNNAYALSNKIFTYLVAGNAIIFSATPAQKQFFEQHQSIGSVYPQGDARALARILDNYLKEPETLCLQKKAARLLAEESLNWEKEQAVFLSLIEKTLGS